MANLGNLTKARMVGHDPWVVSTLDGDVASFLGGLPTLDFEQTPITKGLWAVEIGGAGEGSASGYGTAWVVSAEAFKYLRARRY
jgi:hypothetical protein